MFFPRDRWVDTERGSENMLEWMWEILTTDNEDKNSTQSPEDRVHPSPAESPAQMHQHQSPNMRTTT